MYSECIKTLSSLVSSETDLALLEKLASRNGKTLSTKTLGKTKSLFKKLVKEVKDKTGDKESLISALEKCVESQDLDLDFISHQVYALTDNSVIDNTAVESDSDSDMNDVIPCVTNKSEDIKEAVFIGYKPECETYVTSKRPVSISLSQRRMISVGRVQSLMVNIFFFIFTYC